MGMLQVRLPLPPSGNNFYTIARGRKILSGKARDWRAECVGILQGAYTGKPLEDKDLCLHLTVTFPDRRKRDIDNVIKPLMDVFTQGGIWRDDSQVGELVVTRGGEGPRGTVLATLWSFRS